MRPAPEKNLIGEQPGSLVFLSGVAIAIILGLIIRGLTSPAKIRTMVESAASRIHKDLTVEFSSAELSLQNGLLPRFAVIIHDVRMEAMNECWMAPQLTADEIRLPLSLSSLLGGENPIRQIEGGKVDFYLRSKYKNCEEKIVAATPEPPPPKKFVTLKTPNIKANNETKSGPADAPVEAIYIDQLRISTPDLEEPFDLNSFAIRLKSNSPRVVELTAQTHLVKDPQVVGDYMSHASVWGEYSEFPQKYLRGRLSGNWREGSYSLKGEYAMKEEVLNTELDLKHIPLNQIFQVLKKMNWLKEDLNARQVWVSANAQMIAKKENIKTSLIQVKDVKLEGDLGDVTADDVKITSTDPVRFDPFKVSLERVSLEKILALTNHAHPSPMLARLGNFSGVANVTDPDHLEIEGIHRGLEFVFANKGQREMQTLREVAGKLSLIKDRWALTVSRFVPDQGNFDGSLELSSDREFKKVDIKAKARELNFSPAVVRLMTGGGTFGAFSGDLQIKFHDGKMSAIKGVLNSDNMNIEGIRLDKSRWSLDTASGTDEISCQVQAQNLTVMTSSTAFGTLREMIEPDWVRGEALALKNPSGQIRFKDKSLSWKSFQASLEKGGKILSDGGWDAEGFLSGQLQTRTSAKTAKWQIGGQRDLPVFTPKEK